MRWSIWIVASTAKDDPTYPDEPYIAYLGEDNLVGIEADNQKQAAYKYFLRVRENPHQYYWSNSQPTIVEVRPFGVEKYHPRFRYEPGFVEKVGR